MENVVCLDPNRGMVRSSFFHIFDTTIFLIFCIQIVINIVRLDLTGRMVRLSFVKMMVMITMMVTIIG